MQNWCSFRSICGDGDSESIAEQDSDGFHQFFQLPRRYSSEVQNSENKTCIEVSELFRLQLMNSYLPVEDHSFLIWSSQSVDELPLQNWWWTFEPIAKSDIPKYQTKKKKKPNLTFKTTLQSDDNPIWQDEYQLGFSMLHPIEENHPYVWTHTNAYVSWYVKLPSYPHSKQPTHTFSGHTPLENTHTFGTHTFRETHTTPNSHTRRGRAHTHRHIHMHTFGT